MSQETGKLSQSMPLVKGGLWLWTDIYKKISEDFLNVNRSRDKCFICNNRYPEKLKTTPTTYDCEKCFQMIIEEDFKNWTSGNQELDRVIRQSQLNAKKSNNVFLQVFPFKFGQLEKIGRGGFSTIYLGDLPISRYSNIWEQPEVIGMSTTRYLEQIKHLAKNRYDWESDKRAVLKSFSKSNSNIITNLVKELEVNSKLHGDFITKCYGVTQNPDDGQYMIVMEYAAHGDLRRYLQDPETLINWKYIICLSRWIIGSLCKMHECGFIHKDFHTGNVLINHARRPLIADMGLTTLESDDATPQCWIDLMQQCWDSVPEKRPTAMQVFQKLDKWYQDTQNNIWSEDIKQFLLCDEERYKFRSMSKEKIEEHYSTHPQAIYKSRSMSHYISLMQSCQIDLNEKANEKSINTPLNSSKKRLYSNIGLKENETGITQQIIDISLTNNSSKKELYSIQERSELEANEISMTQQIDISLIPNLPKKKLCSIQEKYEQDSNETDITRQTNDISPSLHLSKKRLYMEIQEVEDDHNEEKFESEMSETGITQHIDLVSLSSSSYKKVRRT
ncbi:unnamed protein product [Rhizophagus irregularis]|nr:unnamed protein product [Rhizophagus irregularis]